MGDVTDRMIPRARTAPLRELSNAGSQGQGQPIDLKAILSEVEPLARSSMLTPKEVDEIIQSTAKMVGDMNVDWTKRLNMVICNSVFYSSFHC